MQFVAIPPPIRKIHGNLTGLKPNQLDRLERIYRRKIPTDQVITQELANYLTELSAEIARQIGVLVNRKGAVEDVIIGDHRQIEIPPLGRFRAGYLRLRGLRYLHTHLADTPLSQEDLTDLALLRFDLVGAIAVNQYGLPAKYYFAHLVPENPDQKRWEVLAPIYPGQVEMQFDEFIHALEEEFQRGREGREVDDSRERAVLVGVSNGQRALAEESLRELRELADSAGLIVMDSVLQHRPKIDPKFMIGKGKLDELIIRCFQLGADMLIFDHDLTPAQNKMISEVTELKIIDRTQLILDIFAQRAHSRVGKLQVELAQLKYQLPRLGTRDDALSRITGGIGARGPGETKLEIDRRRARDRIRNLEKELEHLRKGRHQRRAKRQRNDVPIISIVGYTNAGKSTLLNALTHSEVEVKNQMFATLDPTSRRLRFPKDIEVIITDTVGFLRDLPKDLIEAFRATLEELEDADLLLHVVDISNPEFEEQIAAVQTILEELELQEIPQLMVFNKEDLVEPRFTETVCARYDGVSISAIQRPSLRKLVLRVQDEILRLYPSQDKYPQLKTDLRQENSVVPA
ncbi:GTPase [Candidatus Moduliflexus flocculans]|uniref:GTPase HflX n=1 Tax=Candidatus Moduliflexus flocculans TaxID=1499966 RepID=A0A0S6VZ90_9BACT|nr:GTPase [Candidatus Moduliflexus flocculans]